MSTAKDIFNEAIYLDPTERAKLVAQLITSMIQPDKEIDELYAQESESESGLGAYKQGKLKSISLEEVLSKYR